MAFKQLKYYNRRGNSLRYNTDLHNQSNILETNRIGLADLVSAGFMSVLFAHFKWNKMLAEFQQIYT